jgi:hypothetical protein
VRIEKNIIILENRKMNLLSSKKCLENVYFANIKGNVEGGENN